MGGNKKAMRDKKQCVYYLEKLTVSLWLFYILPYFLRKVGKPPMSSSAKDILVYYFYASWLGLIVSRLTSICVKVKFEPLNFNIFDIHHENGDLVWWNVIFEDSIAIQKYFKGHWEFQKIIKEYQGKNKLLLFLMRRLLVFNDNPLALIKLLLFIRVASNSNLKEPIPVNVFLSSSQRPWLNELRKWAEKENINLIPVGGESDFKIANIILKFNGIKHFIKKMLYLGMVVQYRAQKITLSKKEIISNVSGNIYKTQINTAALTPKLAVEFYGHLNLLSPQLHSDLFFWQQSKIRPEDVLIYFQSPAHPVTDKKWGAIKENNMSAVVINPRAAATPEVPVFNHRRPRIKMSCYKTETDNQNDFLIRKDLYRQVADYHQQLNYWLDFITQYNIKIHVSWYRHEAKCFPLADALEKTGGIGVIYQRTFEQTANPWIMITTDVIFCFSKMGAQLEKDVGSIIPYYIVTGYLVDHRFALLQQEANHLRTRLQSLGAKRIIAYFDENSVDDSRWSLGHNLTQENYAYLLNKVLAIPWLGLIFKPKVFSSLRKRLGNVADLLDRAQETGRCFIFEEGDTFGAHPPAAAALAADVAVHGYLFSATAGVEAALTGTPTLMLDREGCRKSPFYKLGQGVVFNNWNDLWKACQEHWKTSGGIPGFGDWSSMINDIDPFRDGRAAQRMGTYLEWIMEGFKANLPREIVLADAAERYSKMWGKDKVLSINSDVKEYTAVNYLPFPFQ